MSADKWNARKSSRLSARLLRSDFLCDIWGSVSPFVKWEPSDHCFSFSVIEVCHKKVARFRKTTAKGIYAIIRTCI
jgi:hypothetical protein